MALKVTNSGEVLTLSYLVNKEQPQDLVLKLFKNNITPSDTTVAGDLTESDFDGYDDIVLDGDSWTVNAGDPSYAIYAEQDFTSSADQTLQWVYGYYLVRETGGELVWVEKLPTPQAIQNNGDRVSVTPRIELQDATD